MIRFDSDLYYPIHPMNVDAALPMDPEMSEVFYTSNEEGPTGWYPVGKGRTWHTGVHLWSEATSLFAEGRSFDMDNGRTFVEDRVFAIAPGRIVAARLTTADEERERAFGSRGFVLIEHEVLPEDRDEPLTFYVLYHGLTWSDGARDAIDWIPARPEEADDTDTGSEDEPTIICLTEQMLLYPEEHSDTPMATLEEGTIVAWDSKPRASGDGSGLWRRVRMHRQQCPRPARDATEREVIKGWLWLDRPGEGIQEVTPTGDVAVTGVDNLQIRRAPGLGRPTSFEGLSKASEVERLSETVERQEHYGGEMRPWTWQAVRVRLAETEEDNYDAIGVGADQGRWAYGWMYDGDDLSAPTLQELPAMPAGRAESLHAGDITLVDQYVDAGDWIGEVGPMEQDPFGPQGPLYGVHVEVFLAEDPTDIISLPGDAEWIVAEDHSGTDIICDSETVTATAEADDDILGAMWDQARSWATGDSYPAGRHPSRVEAYRDTVVHTTSAWAMDWTVAVDENPEWASLVGLHSEDTDLLDEMNEHTWWRAVEQADADALPARTDGDARVWHVHPIRWLEALAETLPSETLAPYLTDNSIRLRRKPTEGWTTEGAHVEDLQRDLWRFGLDPGAFTGTYGAGTQGAVVCFQIETYYHVIDGRLDPQDAFGQNEEEWIDTWAIDGIAGSGTKEAIRAWLENDLRAEYPREINVATDHPGAPMGYIMLDRGNCDGGVYHYQSRESGDQPHRDAIEWWGLAPIVYTLERVAREWRERGNPTIQIGDMTRPQGGTYWRMTDETYEDHGREDRVTGNRIQAPTGASPTRQDADGTSYYIDHASHRRGWVADIRPMVASEGDVGRPLTTESDAYDQQLSHTFLQLLKSEAPTNHGASMLSNVLFGDEDFNDEEGDLHLDFVVGINGHNNHYHIQYVLDLEN